MDHLRPRLCASLLLLAAALLGPACVYDPDKVCGPNQQKDRDGLCVCVANSVPDFSRNRCTPCGANEIVQGTTCACAMGFERPAAGAACQPMVTGPGTACTAPSMCTVAGFPHCQTPAGASAGYCTSTGCMSNADCPTDYVCDKSATPSHCRRPPTGQGKACSKPEDCQGQQATHCETFFLGQCLVEGCKVDQPGSCHEGWKCCDVTPLGLPKTLCLKGESCPAP